MRNYTSISVQFSRSSFDGSATAASDEPSYLAAFFADFRNERSLEMFIAHVDSGEDWSEPGNYLEIEGSMSHVEMYPYPHKGDFILHPSQFRALLVDFKEFAKSDREHQYRRYPAPVEGF